MKSAGRYIRRLRDIKLSDICSISLNPDTTVRGREAVAAAEATLGADGVVKKGGRS